MAEEKLIRRDEDDTDWSALMEGVRESVVKHFFETDYRGDGAIYANLLLESEFELWGEAIQHTATYFDWEPRSVHIRLPSQAYSRFTNDEDDYRELQSLTAATLPEYKISQWCVHLSLKRREGRKGWDDMLRRTLSNEDADNQGAYIRLPLLDDLSLRYRSQAEMAISKALRRRGVLFFPLPAAVFAGNRLEPDFLICDKGRWGVLEVQGEVFHNKSHTRDHERQKVLHKLGIKYIDYYDGRECHEYPDEVVRKFLIWLEQMYTAP